MYVKFINNFLSIFYVLLKSSKQSIIYVRLTACWNMKSIIFVFVNLSLIVTNKIIMLLKYSDANSSVHIKKTS